MGAPVLRPRILGMRLVEREFLAVTDRAQPIGRDAEGDEVRPHRRRAAFAQRDVVFGGTPLVERLRDTLDP